MVTNAVAFLNNPSVRASSSDKQVSSRSSCLLGDDGEAQVRFLRDHKNLTKDEIVEAYNRANLPIPAFPPQSSTPVQSTSSSQRTDNYRPAPKEVRCRACRDIVTLLTWLRSQCVRSTTVCLPH